MHLICAIMSPFTGVEAVLKTVAELALCSSSGMTDWWKLEHGTWIEVWQHRGKRLSVLECDMRQYLPCSASPFSKQKAGCQVQGLNGLDLQLETFCMHWGKWDVQIALEIWKFPYTCVMLNGHADYMAHSIHKCLFLSFINLSFVPVYIPHFITRSWQTFLSY